MNLLHVIASVNPANGGPSVCVPDLGAAQARHGHSVTLAFPVDDDYSEYGIHLAKNIPSISELNLVKVPTHGIMNRLEMRVPDEVLSAAIRQSDIVHLHGVWDPFVISAAVQCLKLKKAYVICPHGMLNKWSLQQKTLKKKIILSVIVRNILNNSAFVHVLNTNEKEEINRLCPDARPRVFANGIFAEQFNHLPETGSFRKSYPGIGDRPYLLFLARLHRQKGLDYLIDAFIHASRKIAELDLVIAGPDGGEKAMLERRIYQENLMGRVHLAGPLYGDIKFAAINDALGLIQTSRNEGFSVTIVESLACGTPVIISENCYFPEVAEKGGGYVVPLAIEAISDTIIELVNLPDNGLRMGEQARKLMFDNYTWDHIADRLIHAYRNVWECNMKHINSPLK